MVTRAGFFFLFWHVRSVRARTNPNNTPGVQSATAQMTEWDDAVPAAVRFLHELFPDINPRSRVLIEDNDEWSHSQRRLNTFTINVCDPVFSTELKIHCSV